MSASERFDLSSYRIPGSDSCFYIPEFITEGEEAYLIRKIRDSPAQRWKQLANRRLQLWGGELTSNNVLVAQPMPSFVETYPDIINRLQQTGVFHGSPHAKPNHIIMNEYEPGQGIMPHEDGPAYHPAVATISLNSHCVFHYYRYTLPESHGGRSIDPTPVLSLLLEPRSVVISTDSLYSNHLHSIHEIKEDRFTAGGVADFGSPIANWERVTDAATREVLANGGALTRGTRYSLTCRDVGKVAQLKSFVKR